MPIFKKLIIVSLSLYLTTAATAQPNTSTEKVIAQLNKADLVDNTLSLSNDKSKIGYRVRSGKQQAVSINGEVGPYYDSVTTPVFSYDSRHYAYAALREGAWQLIADGKVQEMPEQANQFVFYTFSPLDKLVCIIKQQDRLAVVHDHIASPWYSDINPNSITFSKEGNSMAYSVTLQGKQAVRFNDSLGAFYDEVGFPVISSSGTRIAYWAMDNAQAFAVIDNQQSAAYDRVLAVKFSSDSKHYAFHAKKGKAHVVVVDGVQSENYEFVHSLTYSPIGNRLAYAIESDKHNDQGFNHAIVLDGKQMKTYETVVEGSLVFSPDSKRFSYEVEWHDEFFVVTNGSEGKRYGDIVQITITFSPNSSRLAYVYENDSRRRVSIDGKTGEDYDDVSFIAFSPDSRHVAYSAKQGVQEFIVVDSKRRKSYDSILGQGEIIFDSNDSFHYVAKQGDTIYLVTESTK